MHALLQVHFIELLVIFREHIYFVQKGFDFIIHFLYGRVLRLDNADIIIDLIILLSELEIDVLQLVLVYLDLVFVL